MAEGDGFIVNTFKELCMEGAHNLTSDTVRVALIGTGWTQTIDGALTYATVSAREMSGTGYTATGDAPGTPTVVVNDTNDRGEFNLVDASWAALTLTGGTGFPTPNTAFMYNDTHGSNAAIAYWELGTTATNGSQYDLQWGATVMNLT